ncbi:MAG: glutathione S-transferase [Pseudomonadota bacterium]
MSARFTLYYWPIPFRAQSIRYILAYAGETWSEPSREDVLALYQGPITKQPMPFMGPPLLRDHQEDVWISQSCAIASYLGEVLHLTPGSPAKDALTQKVLGDCVDVLQALTRDCGATMWTAEEWTMFAEHRLPRWLQIFEELGARHDLKPDSGTLLGTPEPGVADLACAALWIPICDKLPKLQSVIAEHAPNVLALSQRLSNLAPIAALRAEQAERWGDVWCEGQIEESLRNVLASWRS